LETGHWGSTETTSIIKMFEKYRDNPRVVIHALNKLDAAMGAPPELAAKWFARNVGMQAREGDLIIGASCNTAWNESLEEMWRFREPNPGGPISRPTGGGPTGAAPTGPGPMDAEPAYGGRAPAAPKAPVGFGPWEQRIGMGQLIHYNRHPNGRIVIVGHGAQYQGQMIRVPSHIRELRYYGKAGEPYLGYVTYEAFQEGVDVQTKAGYTLQVAKPGDLVPQHVLAPLSEWDKELLSDMGYTLEYGTQVEEGTITLDQLLTQMPEGASVDLSACRGDLKDVKWLGAGKK
jgi:hypothetical protein